MTLVSVLLPVFNGEAFVSTALDGLLSQEGVDFEVVAVDDGSTDQTLSILNDYARKDPRVRVVPIAHGGIVAALNAGLAACSGCYIARMDADDVCLPGRLQTQAYFLDRNPCIGLVAGKVIYGGDADLFGGFSRYVDWVNQLESPEDIRMARFIESPLIHPSVMFRAKLIQTLGFYRDGLFPEDYELWLRFLEAGVQMTKVPEEVVVWNERPKRLSRTHPRYGEEAFYRLKADYLARLLQGPAYSGRSLLVWGAGKTSRRRAAFLMEHGVEIDGYVDIDPKKIGNQIDGVRVVPKTDIRKGDLVFSYAGARGARELIQDYLESSGFIAENDFILVS